MFYTELYFSLFPHPEKNLKKNAPLPLNTRILTILQLTKQLILITRRAFDVFFKFLSTPHDTTRTIYTRTTLKIDSEIINVNVFAKCQMS